MANVGQRTLTDSEIASAKALIVPLLPQAQGITFSNALANKRRIYDAYMSLSAADRATTSSASNDVKVQFIVALDNLGGGDFDLGTYFWNSSMYLNSIKTVASGYSIWKDQKFTNMSYFQVRIFDDQPSPIYRDLIKNNIQITGDAAVQSAMVTACENAVNNDFKITKDSLDSFLSSANYAGSQSQSVKDAFRRIWRVSPMCRSPQDALSILCSGYASATQVANTSKSTFVGAMVKLGSNEDSAVAMHDIALSIELRNEQAWVAMLAAKSNWTPAAISSSNPTSSNLAKAEILSGPKQVITYSNLFGDINVNACEECSSITGPAAYFVDLLRMLKNSLCNPTVATSASLLDKLFARRPDLKNLQLSCANVNSLLPYVDVVNEIMESFISNLATADASGNIKIQTGNVDIKDTSANLIVQPTSTNFDVYRQQIGTQVFPQNVFPYNQAIDTMRCCFSAFGSSRFQIMSVFGSKYRLNADTGGSGLSAYSKAENVMRTALAAEYLSLQPDDFVSITYSSIFSLDYFRSTGESSLMPPAYSSRIGMLTAAQYWGYTDPAQTAGENIGLMTGETKGLAVVTEQLIPRAAISIQDVLTLLKTRFLGGKLALENSGNTPIFSGDFSDLRLRHPLEGDMKNSSNPLTEVDCLNLQAFLRLWRKSKLSMPDLDLALSYFSDYGGKAPLANDYPSINSDCIIALAALRQLVDITGLTIETLMPLYGLIDTYGNDHLYGKLFLQGKPNRTDPVFGKSTSGKYLSDDSRKLSDSRGAVQAALAINDADWNAILQTGSIFQDVLNLSNLSMIYRIVLFCKIVKINPSQYLAFVSLFGTQSPFKSPSATLKILQSWQGILDAGFDLDLVLYVNGKSSTADVHISSYGIPPLRELVGPVSTFLTSAIASEKEVPPANAITTTSATANEVFRIASLMFDPVLAGQVKDFVEAPTNAQATIYQNVLLPFFQDVESDATAKFFKAVQPTGTPEDVAITWETQAIDRRMLFLQQISQSLRLRLNRDLVLDVAKSLLPDVDLFLVRFFLSDDVRSGSSDKAGLDLLSDSLASNRSSLTGTSVTAYFTPAFTDTYRFYVTDAPASTAPAISLEGSALTFEYSTSVWKSNEFSLTSGQAYLLTRLDGNFVNCTYSTQRLANVSFGSDTLTAQQTLTSFGDVFESTFRAVRLVTQLSLNVNEVVYFKGLSASSPLAVDFATITYANIQKLLAYVKLRDELGSTAMAVLDYLKWVNDPSRVGALADKLSNVTGIPTLQVQDFLNAKYPKISLEDLFKAFQDVQELRSLLDAWKLMSGLGVPGLTFTLLFKWASPFQPGGTATEFDNASELRMLTRSMVPASDEDSPLTKANNALRDNQRLALINYLLEQPYLRQKLVFNEANLFEFFLVDVQMGSCLKTSRMQQAISTVQLFIKRSTLGLEKPQGVASSAVNLDRWQWMQKFRLWQAHRLVYLYPENYLDPTLRDDKSDAFKVFEDKLIQSDLSESTMTDMIRSYIHEAAEVADLDVVAWEYNNSSTWGDGTFHFFCNDSPLSIQFLLPPTGDISTIETDADGKPLSRPGAYLVPALVGRRLILFLPQISLRTISDSTTSTNTKTFQQVGSENARANVPQRVWQIQLGWTEYQNGRWSPKKISPSALTCGPADPNAWPVSGCGFDSAQMREFQKMPLIQAFKFYTNRRTATVDGAPQDILGIYVEQRVARSGADDSWMVFPVGLFELCGQVITTPSPTTRMPRGGPADGNGSRTIPTLFGRAVTKCAANDTSDSGTSPWYNSSFRGSSYKFVAVYPKIPSTAERTLRWTYDYNEALMDQFYANFIEMATADSVVTYFVYPKWNRAGSTSWDITSNTLMSKLLESTTTYPNLDQVFATLGGIPSTAINSVLGMRNGTWYELSTPTAIYNWELGVHTIMSVVERLQATQQFDLALKVARYLFDPTVEGTDMTRAWKFIPFKGIAKDKIQTAEDILKALSASSGSESTMDFSILEWRKNPFLAHVIARSRPSAYMKRIVMKYIEILIASGDEYFRQNSLEAVTFALQRYIEASQVFGSAPKPVPKLGRSKPATYSDLESTLNDFSNASFDMELDFPYYSDPAKRGGGGKPAAYPLTGILKSTYFCVPTNPNLLALGDLINDRLFKIRNCQDINGMARHLSLWEPPLDVGMLTQAVSKGISLTSLLNDTVGPMPNFRFAGLIEKALDMSSELKAMSSSFLAIREAKDAEGLAFLQAVQESKLQTMVMDMKVLAKKEVERSIEELQETRRGQETRLKFFLGLTGDAKSVPGSTEDWIDVVQNIDKPTTDDLRMSTNEKLEQDKNDSANRLSSKAVGLDISAAIVRLIPDITFNCEPLGVGTTVSGITVNISDAMAMGAGVMRAFADMDYATADRAGRKAELISQLQERRMEANAAGHDIKVTDKQIATLNTSLAICDEDIKQQKKLIENATQTSEYLRSKYTSEQLYSWMDGQIRSLFYQTFLLANNLAKKAQKVYRFERSGDTTSYVDQSYWDSGHDGIFSGENLYLGLKRMEAAYLEKRGYDFAITKNISLRKFQPLAFFTLRESGTAEFILPEWMFDFDFPGHYFRRIKTLSLSVTSSSDLSAGFNTTLTLLEHKYRVNPTGNTGSDYLPKTTSDDDRFRTDQVPITSIAVSNSNEDSGAFDHELEFNDNPRFVPFEGAGAISRWRLELPMAVKQFDYSTLNDLVIKLKYTAYGGSAAFKKAASDAAKAFQGSVKGLTANDGLFAVVDVKTDFPSQWAVLTQTPATQRSVNLSGLATRLPSFTQKRTVIVETISALVYLTTATTLTEGTLTVTGDKSVPFLAQQDIGATKVMRATGLTERFTDWAVGISSAGVSAAPQSIIFVIRYYLA